VIEVEGIGGINHEAGLIAKISRHASGGFAALVGGNAADYEVSKIALG
jgi:hypothetical protein